MVIRVAGMDDVVQGGRERGEVGEVEGGRWGFKKQQFNENFRCQ